MSAPKPVVLCILDGWGLSAERAGNAPLLARTPTMDRLMQTCPNATLVTHGPDVGLPRGQMGNSEVGHTNIGAGRVVAMDLGQIDLAVEEGSFARNARLESFISELKRSGGAAHLLGLVSDGGVHGHINHMIAAADALVDAGVPVFIHALTDGRDVAPASAIGFMQELIARLPSAAQVATVSGRYFALDRDTRWDRVQRAYEAIVHAHGQTAPDAQAALAQAYEKGETDEFITPTVLAGYTGAKDGDAVFCLNFRADRAREIMSAIGAPDFASFETGKRPRWAALMGMAQYSDVHEGFMTTMYPKPDIVNTLGDWVSQHGLRQYRIAETEKYPHVTFFLNGGEEISFAGEDRFMPKSPNVDTYDEQPEMSAPQVTAKLVAAIRAEYDLIVVNYANPDMVGHTGNLAAAIAACEAVDEGLAQVIEALDAVGGAMIVTADHGNCDVMIDPVTGGPHTAHTLNPVPVVAVGVPAGASMSSGRLADLAPTLLSLMQLPVPDEMTGTCLLS